MSDYFFYDLNKKMADLANKQQLAETTQATPVKPATSALRTQLNERDMGKHNNATTGFAALAKKTGGGEKGAKIAGAQLAKMRAKGQVEEGSKPDFLDLDKDGNRKEPMKSAARGAKKDMDESALQAAFGMKKYGDQGMKALQKAGRDHASAKTMSNIRNKYDKYDESQGMTDEGNAFSGAVTKAKRDGIQPGEKITVGGKQYELKEVDATPQHVDEPVSKPMAKASAANRSSSKRPDPNVPGSMIVVGKDTGPLPKRKTPTSAPNDEDGATAPPAKGPDGRYPIVTSGPNKGKRWSPSTPGPTNPAMKEGGAAPGGPGDYNYIKDNYQNVTLNGRIIGMTADGGKTFITSRPAEFESGSMPQGATVDQKQQTIKPMRSSQPGLGEGGVPMTPKQKKFAKLAPPMDKITFADRIVGAKKEVDEMLGDVAATAMKNAVGKMRGRNRDMEEGFMDDEPTSRRSSSGGRIDTSEPGVTRHRAVKGNYSGAGHDASADDNDEPSGQIGRRKVGAGMGKKIGAKINRGTSKLMTKEGDMPEDMIEPQDSGEYDQEGDMAKDTIKTVVRHAQALEKILGDDDNLPEWVQSKLAKIENMMTAVDDYMQNQNDDDMPMEEERTNKRDNRAEKAGRKVAKDIEYDEKKKDGIHGKRRGSEDSKAERAGKKVTKDIEYDEKKDKKKEVDETTTSGSVATGSAPKSGSSHNYGKGIYDSLNRQLENMISEGMNINMSMNNDDHGGPKKSLTVTATDEDAVMLSSLLKMAGLGNDDDHMHDMTDDDSQMLAIQTMGDEDACSSCGSSPCGCDDQMMDEDRWGAEQPPKLPNDMTVTADGGVDVKKSGSDWVYKSKEPGGRVTVTIPAKAANKMLPNTEMDEAYGDTDASENDPDYPTDEVGTADEGMYSGGLDGPKSTGQTTIPVIAGQHDRMGYNGDHELRRMMEIAGLR